MEGNTCSPLAGRKWWAGCSPDRPAQGASWPCRLSKTQGHRQHTGPAGAALEGPPLEVGTRPGKSRKGTTSGMGPAAPLIEQGKCRYQGLWLFGTVCIYKRTIWSSLVLVGTVAKRLWHLFLTVLGRFVEMSISKKSNQMQMQLMQWQPGFWGLCSSQYEKKKKKKSDVWMAGCQQGKVIKKCNFLECVWAGTLRKLVKAF